MYLLRNMQFAETTELIPRLTTWWQYFLATSFKWVGKESGRREAVLWGLNPPNLKFRGRTDFTQASCGWLSSSYLIRRRKLETVYFHGEKVLKTILVPVNFPNSKLLHSGGNLTTLLKPTILFFNLAFPNIFMEPCQTITQ